MIVDFRGLQGTPPPATGAADTVLLCHHWIRPLHVNNRLVQLSYQIWAQKTTEGIRPAERIIGTTPPPLSKNCTHPEWAKELTKSLWTLIQHTLSVNGYRLVDATELWAPERPDTEPVSSLRQSSHEHLTIIMVHALFIHLCIQHTYLVYTSGAHNIPVHTKLSIVIYLYIQLSMCILLLFFIYLFFLLSVLLFFCTAVASVTKTNSSYV